MTVLDSAFEQLQNTTDALGNIFDNNGNHIGVVPGSVADLGSAGKPFVAPQVTPPVNSGSTWTPQTQDGLNSAIDSYAQTSPQNKILNFFSGGTLGKGSGGIFGVTLEDAVTILVGIILIGAGLFAFKQTQTIIQTGGRVARAGAEVFAT